MPGHLQEGFGCVVTNRFDQLFDDEEDPFELLKQAQNKKKEAPAAGAKSAAQAAKQPKKESQKDRKVPLPDKKEETQAPVPLKKEGMRRMGRRPEQQGQQGSQQASQQGSQQQQQPQQQQQQQQQQGGQGEGRPQGERRPDRRPPRERRTDKPADEKPAEGGEFSVEKSVGDRPFRGRGGGRGGRGGRGRGVGRNDGFDMRGKREFDRHSGSDRSLKAEEKRGGSGSHNWGTVKDELRSVQNELDQSNVTDDAHEGEEHPPADSENKENEVEEVKEEGAKEMTLDEWKAQQDKDRAKVDFNIRKANEGADWNKGFLLHKSKAKDSPADEAAGDHHFRKPANDITSQLEINFGDLGRPGRGRGGPRGGRGARGAPTTRPPRERRPDKGPGGSAPDVDDPEAFPALA